MATSVTPVPETPIPDNSQESLSQQTPQIEPPQVGPSNQLDEAALGVIREQNARIQALQDQLIAAKSAPPPSAPAPTEEELNKNFYENPARFFAERENKIQKMLEQTVAPLQEQYQTFKRDSVIDGFIAQAKIDPRIAGSWNPQLESYVRTELAKMPPAQVNENAFIQIAVMGVGLQSLKQLPGSLPNSNTNVPPAAPAPTNLPSNSSVIPPHMRPTPTPPTPVNTGANGKQYRDLTEDEARLAREMRMTKEEYLDFMSLDKNAVVSSTIGRRQQ